MVKKPDSNAARIKRHKRVRSKISGTPECPRLCVFRSAKHIYAQIIDDVNGKTLVSASTLEMDFTEYGGNKDAAKKVGELHYHGLPHQPHTGYGIPDLCSLPGTGHFHCHALRSSHFQAGV